MWLTEQIKMKQDNKESIMLISNVYIVIVIVGIKPDLLQWSSVWRVEFPDFYESPNLAFFREVRISN